MNIATRYVSRDYLRNGKLNIQGGSISNSGSSSYGGLTGNYLPAISNGDGTYLVDLSKVLFTGSIVAYGEVTAYGAGESGGSNTVGNVTIYDGLDSVATDVALSANQGRILKELIGEGGGGGGSISTLTDVTLTNLEDGLILKYDATLGYWVNGDGTKVTWLNIEGKPEGLTDENIQKIVDFKADDYLLKSVWDSVFTIDDSGNLRVKSNLIGEKEISAYGDGINSGSGSGVTIYDGLDSTSKDVALSANQGRVLKNLIDNIDFPDIDTSWSNISGKPTFATVATSGSYNDLSNKPTIPTNNNLLTNGAGYITGITKSMVTTALGYTPPTTNTTYSASTGLSLSTSNAFSVKYGTAAGTACQGNDSRLSDARPASDVYSWAKASSKPTYSWSEITSKPSFATVATSGKYSDLSGTPTIPTNNNQLINGAGYITSSGSISGNAGSATKLATARTLWGLSFNGTANVSGNITGSYFKINDTSTNPYLQLTLGSTWYIQGYSGYLYLGAGSTKSLRIDSSGNCLSVGEVTAHSDKRLKTDIRPLEVRGELNPVTYVKDGKESIGFIADEVKEVYPELVVTDESTDEKYLSLNYAQLTAVLYAEIKELKNQIRELNEKVRTMAN